MWEGDPTLSGSKIRPERFLGPLGRAEQLGCGVGVFTSLLSFQGPPQSSPQERCFTGAAWLASHIHVPFGLLHDFSVSALLIILDNSLLWIYALGTVDCLAAFLLPGDKPRNPWVVKSPLMNNHWFPERI